MEQDNSSKNQKKVLKDIIIDHILEKLFRGEYRPGDKIRELNIARELDVSQSVVREGITYLKALGVLEHKPYTQTSVRFLSRDEMEDHYKLRLELESLAFQWVMENPSWKNDLCDSLSLIISEMAEASEKSDMYLFRKADFSFHRTLVEASGSQSLTKAWELMGPIGWLNAGPILEFEEPSILHMELKLQVAVHDSMLKAIRKENLDQFRILLDKQFPRMSIKS